MISVVQICSVERAKKTSITIAKTYIRPSKEGFSFLIVTDLKTFLRKVQNGKPKSVFIRGQISTSVAQNPSVIVLLRKYRSIEEKITG